MPGLLLLTVLLLAVCPIIGWLRWHGVETDSTTVQWRKVAGLLGLTANSLAIAVPFVACLYQFTRNTYSLNVPMPDFPLIIRFSFFLAIGGLIGGVLAPRRIGLVTAVGGLIISSVILAVPIIFWR
jgi:hypothetical protein